MTKREEEKLLNDAANYLLICHDGKYGADANIQIDYARKWLSQVSDAGRFYKNEAKEIKNMLQSEDDVPSVITLLQFVTKNQYAEASWF